MTQELETQRFLRGGGTLADLATVYGIKVKTDEALGVVMLNYNQIASPMEEPICQECRALLLETGSWQVVSRSFFKFFNHGEPNAHPLDWTTARVQEKRDGSLICLYFHRAQWQVATKGTPDASGPVNSHPMTFRDLVKQALRERGSSWEELTAQLDPNIFYSFELTAPENRIIVPYEDRRLTWLAAWDRQTLAEREITTLPDLPTPRVWEYPLRTLDEVLALQTRLAAFRREVAQTYDSLASVGKRREFAREALHYPFSPLLFWRRDGHDMAECFLRLPPDRLVEWLAVPMAERNEE